MKKNRSAVALGKLGGKVGGRSKSEAKKAAAAANGLRGGRPAILCAHCGKPAAQHHAPKRYCDHSQSLQFTPEPKEAK